MQFYSVLVSCFLTKFLHIFFFPTYSFVNLLIYFISFHTDTLTCDENWRHTQPSAPCLQHSSHSTHHTPSSTFNTTTTRPLALLSLQHLAVLVQAPAVSTHPITPLTSHHSFLTQPASLSTPHPASSTKQSKLPPLTLTL